MTPSAAPRVPSIVTSRLTRRDVDFPWNETSSSSTWLCVRKSPQIFITRSLIGWKRSLWIVVAVVRSQSSADFSRLTASCSDKIFQGRRGRRDELPRRPLGSKDAPVRSINIFAFDTKVPDFFFCLTPPCVGERGRPATDGAVRVALMMMKIQGFLEDLRSAARLCRVRMSNGRPRGERRLQGLQKLRLQRRVPDREGLR